MSERNYFVFCENGCKFPAMTAEQTLAAIAEATGKTGVDCDKAYITQVKEQNANSGLKFWVGTTAEYNALSEKVDNCLYILTDDSTATDFNAAVEDMRKEIKETTDNVKSALNEMNNEIDVLSTDYVVETGTADGWTFRKWASGNCELHGSFEFKIDTPTTAVNMYFYTAGDKELPFYLESATVSAVVASSDWSWINSAYFHDGNKVNVKITSTTKYSSNDNQKVPVDILIHGTIKSGVN